MNLVSDRDSFIWKGHDKLKVKEQLLNDSSLPIEDGLQVTSILQVLPPGSITCLALHSSWNLVAAGTAHGLVLFDYHNHFPVLHRCTLNPNDLTGAGEALSRRKSFKKTLRESFRRLRKGRSTRNNPGATQIPITETRPVERQIESRPVDDAMNSLVRCVTFAQTFIDTKNRTYFIIFIFRDDFLFRTNIHSMFYFQRFSAHNLSNIMVCDKCEQCIGVSTKHSSEICK